MNFDYEDGGLGSEELPFAEVQEDYGGTVKSWGEGSGRRTEGTSSYDCKITGTRARDEVSPGSRP